MRLIGSIPERRLAQEFSYYLIKEGIQNHFDPGHDNGQEVYHIWVVDEDYVDQASTELQQFLANPQDPQYLGHYREAKRVEQAQMAERRQMRAADEEIAQRAQTIRRPVGVLTIVLILASTLILFWGGIKTIPIGDKSAIVVTQPPASMLLFDFPRTLELFNELSEKYPEEEIQNPSTLPQAGRALLREAETEPWWQGLYGELVAWLAPGQLYQDFTGPLFVKISQGQIWRLFSPAILHVDIVHLLFNMIWLFILGTQVEGRIGWLRYGFLLLLAALITNVSQYLVSGPLFMGMSGVVCVLFGFIWMRQRHAPWEGYQLNRITIAFIVAFIVAMFLFQVVSFGFELSGRGGIGPPIANTAHIVGLIVGAVLGRWDLFAYHAVGSPNDRT